MLQSTSSLPILVSVHSFFFFATSSKTFETFVFLNKKTIIFCRSFLLYFIVNLLINYSLFSSFGMFFFSEPFFCFLLLKTIILKNMLYITHLCTIIKLKMLYKTQFYKKAKNSTEMFRHFNSNFRESNRRFFRVYFSNDLNFSALKIAND